MGASVAGAGGMPGMGQVPPGLMEALLSDPAMMAALQDPDVMACLQDPSKLATNPKAAALFAKLQGMFGK